MIGKRVGNYVIDRPLGRGGMGSVFVARHPTLGREVAVKFLDEELSAHPELAQRFLEEAKITAQLRHPHIVEILDFGELEGRFYTMMEFLVGEALSSHLQKLGRLPESQAIEYLRQICAGVGAAHQMGIVHRDLKPENIFVMEQHPLCLKLLDFGIAKILSPSPLAGDVGQTRHGQLLGTPSHMAPEQALGHTDQITPRTDLYAIGVIGYRLLTGRQVFVHESPMVLLSMHVRDPIVPLRFYCPDLHPELARLIESCLSKSPDDRPSSAAALSQALVALSSPELTAPIPTGMTGPAATGLAEVRSPSPAALEPSLRALAPPAPSLALRQDTPRCLSPRAKSPLPAGPTAASAPGPSGSIGGLTSVEEGILNRLFSRMRQRGDFPGFLQHMGEVQKRADHSSAFSAEQLAASILKDYALTAKLLKVVNSAYSARFQGKVYSIRHAIVILGFERVRALALSLSLFQPSPSNARSEQSAERSSESAISALVSGELARELATLAQVSDADQAALAAMFQNLGRHLILVYLPEHYDQILALAERQLVTLEVASFRVLGISFQRIGAAIGEQWHLPERVLSSLSDHSANTQLPNSETERLGALARLSNDLCDCILLEDPERQKQAATAILARYRDLLVLLPEELGELTHNVNATFRMRYQSLLGRASDQSRLLRAITQRTQPETPGSRTGTTMQSISLDDLLPQPPTSASRPMLAEAHAASTEVKPLSLVKASKTPAAAPALGASTNLLGLLEALARALGVPRILGLRANASKSHLELVRGVGPEVEALRPILRFPIHPNRKNGDVFSSGYHSGVDARIRDAFSERAQAVVPQAYYELLGSPAFLLMVCAHRGHGPTLLVIDAERAESLPSPEAIAQQQALRQAIAVSVD